MSTNTSAVSCSICKHPPIVDIRDTGKTSVICPTCGGGTFSNTVDGAVNYWNKIQKDRIHLSPRVIKYE